jgi:hypothetical protein
MQRIKGFSLAATVLGLTMGAWAQTSTSTSPTATTSPNATSVPPTATKPKTSINQRKTDQQDRVAQGLQSGQLTARETRNIEGKEAGLNKEENAMRKADDGHLTSGDRQELNQQQNKLSNQIHQDKHNAAKAAQPGTELNDRRVDQRDRIAQGVKSGQLTTGETAKIENREVQTNKTEGAMKAANGGKLTQGDKAELNKQYNKTSGKIYQDKHNNRTR